jgi:F0F1-type ATP synthase assembly protein I
MDESEDLVARERTYHAFNMLIRWSMVLLASGILWLTLWFATSAGFWGGTLVGVVAFVAGYYFVIRHEAHQPLDPWVAGR